MIRRTEEILQKFLPPKHEIILFMNPSENQLEIYNEHLTQISKTGFNAKTNKISNFLPVMISLQKILFHPELFRQTLEGPFILLYLSCSILLDLDIKYLEIILNIILSFPQL